MKKHLRKILVVGFMIGGLLVWALYPRIEIKDLREGVGDAVQMSQRVTFEYELFANDKEAPIFSTFQQKQPQTITLGQAQHIPGIEQALLGMKPGGRRWVRIPWILGYGWKGGAGGLVPPRADLEAVIELKSSGSVN